MKAESITFFARMDAVGRLRIPKEVIDAKKYVRGDRFEVTIKRVQA